MRARIISRHRLLSSRLAWPVQSLGRRTFAGSAARFEDSRSNDSDIVKPWYVLEAEKQSAQQQAKQRVELPAMPQDSPKLLRKVAYYAAADMGLKNVQIIDRRHKSELTSGALNPSFMVVGTGTSTRHLQSAGLQLLTWLKREYNIFADKEGILTTNYVRLHNRRQRRKQQRQRFSGGATPDVVQRVGSWIVIDTKVENIYLHLMTQERRDEVDLEHLDEEDGGTGAENANDATSATDYVVPKRAASGGASGRRGIHTEVSRVPDTREELALQNLWTESQADLTEDSTEVHDFVEHFPRFPTRVDWKHRLQFFALAATKSPNFSLRRVVDEAECQQASGFVLDDDDVEMVVSTICYHGQSHFAQLSRNEETLASWEQFCDYKAALLIRLFEFALQPTKRSLIQDPRLIVLLYRTFVGPSRDSVTPEQALAFPEKTLPHKLDMFFDRRRNTPIRLMLEETPEALSVQNMSMVLTSLVNGRSYDAFWKVANLLLVGSGNDREAVSLITELALALIIKSGDNAQIVHGIQTFLPTVVLKKNMSMTPTLIATLESALACVSAGRRDAFPAVRALLDHYKKDQPKLK